jgi:hypothetical protein
MSKYDYLKVTPHVRISTWWMNEVVNALNELYGYYTAIDSLRYPHSKSNFTLDGQTETSIYSVTAKGLVNIEFKGDGDGVFTIRVYVDDTLDEEIPTNTAKIGCYSFKSKLEVKIYNPTTLQQTASSTTFKLCGLIIKL